MLSQEHAPVGFSTDVGRLRMFLCQNEYRCVHRGIVGKKP